MMLLDLTKAFDRAVQSKARVLGKDATSNGLRTAADLGSLILSLERESSRPRILSSVKRSMMIPSG